MVSFVLVPLGLFLAAFFVLIPAFLFWMSWTYFEIGVTYFSFLPSQFHVIPFTDCFLLLLAIGIVGNFATGGLGRHVQKIKVQE